MLLTKTVKVKWRSNSREHYESKGYIFTKCGEEFEAKVEDLTRYSSIKVDVKCDCPDCKDPYLKPIPWSNYISYVHEDEKYYCSNCARKLFGIEKQRKANLKKSISFEQWCYENLDIDYANEILSRWDSEKNKCLPSEVSYCSTGFNKKGYWFKCLRGIHESELKRITNFINGHLETIDCNQCNSFAQWGIDNIGKNFLEKYWDYEKNKGINPWEISYACHDRVYIYCQKKDYHGSYDTLCKEFSVGEKRCPYCAGNQFGLHPKDSLGQYLEDNGLLHLWSDKNEKSPFEYSPKSKQEVWWKCPDGRHEDFYRAIGDSNNYNFRCPECQSKLGETKISKYLTENSIDYIPQMKFEGLYGIGNGKLSYDFYLLKYNILLEFQGKQHEKPIDFGGFGIEKAKENFEKQQEHDRRKREYAEKNNIKLLEIWYWDFENIEKILSEYI